MVKCLLNTTGAIICQSVYQQKGLAGIKALLNSPVDDNAFMDELCKLYGIPKNELNNYMRKEILKYAAASDAGSSKETKQ